jgi:hypothetical protein
MSDDSKIEHDKELVELPLERSTTARVNDVLEETIDKILREGNRYPANSTIPSVTKKGKPSRRRATEVQYIVKSPNRDSGVHLSDPPALKLSDVPGPVSHSITEHKTTAISKHIMEALVLPPSQLLSVPQDIPPEPIPSLLVPSKSAEAIDRFRKSFKCTTIQQRTKGRCTVCSALIKKGKEKCVVCGVNLKELQVSGRRKYATMRSKQ